MRYPPLFLAALVTASAAAFAQTPTPVTEPPGPAVTRDFCGQDVTFTLADPAAAAPQYRDFIGIWSDAAWTPQLCAALIVETVTPEGGAAVVYAYGPQAPNARSPGGVLRGTGIIQNGELRFQNSDGSQFAFRPYYADLDGSLVTPKGQSLHAIFKKTY